jgi:methylated-DNA-protein-cysteine methyltransferase-like protein
MGFSSHPNPQVFQALVWDIARQVPPGKVSTYGQIAGMIPPPASMNLKDYEAFGARWVGGAMANCPEDVPWQRVINSQGKISQRPGAEKQRQLLEGESVQFDERDRVDFDQCGWSGPDSEWCRQRGLFTPKALGKTQPKLF